MVHKYEMYKKLKDIKDSGDRDLKLPTGYKDKIKLLQEETSMFGTVL